MLAFQAIINEIGMFKYFLAILSACSLMNVQASEEIQSGNADADFPIEFDDFPDNSTPDLEQIFEDCMPKDLEDFTTLPETSEIIDQQSQFGVDFHGFPNTIVNGCVNVISGDFQV